MTEIKHEAKIYEVDYICDTCGKGKMIDSKKHAVVAPDESLQYEHICNKCGEKVYLFKRYPFTDTVPFGTGIK
ncbi:MAG: hypothetical protein GWP19_12115 [Planctomycetia bacterium]|nr:hypothetical protein [Planctomycetia bacterium]